MLSRHESYADAVHSVCPESWTVPTATVKKTGHYLSTATRRLSLIRTPGICQARCPSCQGVLPYAPFPGKPQSGPGKIPAEKSGEVQPALLSRNVRRRLVLLLSSHFLHAPPLPVTPLWLGLLPDRMASIPFSHLPGWPGGRPARESRRS